MMKTENKRKNPAECGIVRAKTIKGISCSCCGTSVPKGKPLFQAKQQTNVWNVSLCVDCLSDWFTKLIQTLHADTLGEREAKYVSEREEEYARTRMPSVMLDMKETLNDGSTERGPDA